MNGIQQPYVKLEEHVDVCSPGSSSDTHSPYNGGGYQTNYLQQGGMDGLSGEQACGQMWHRLDNVTHILYIYIRQLVVKTYRFSISVLPLECLQAEAVVGKMHYYWTEDVNQHIWLYPWLCCLGDVTPLIV